jgi:hypothetical protein
MQELPFTWYYNFVVVVVVVVSIDDEAFHSWVYR